jgi:hypothetical protein
MQDGLGVCACGGGGGGGGGGLREMIALGPMEK